jgi:hypothetical protein
MLAWCGQTAVIGPGTGCTTIISLLIRHSIIILQDNSRHDLGMDRPLSGDCLSREHRRCVMQTKKSSDVSQRRELLTATCWRPECLRLQQLQTGSVGSDCDRSSCAVCSRHTDSESVYFVFVLSPSMPVPLHKPKTNVDNVLLHAFQSSTH